MKILITSGGTKVKIDMVRHISNMSKGTFGSHIAESFAVSSRRNTDCKIKFLMAKGSKYPQLTDIPWITFAEYETFDDYSRELFAILNDFKPDIVVLAAAVSDYGVENYVDGKIRSKDELVIRLKPLPKLISKVRDYVPDAVICGFKLLVNSTDKELSDACIDSLIKNRLDLVVGNDLRDIKNSNHKLMIYRNMDGVVSCARYDDKKDSLSDAVSNSCIEMYNRRNK